jgi:hypothetical protein
MGDVVVGKMTLDQGLEDTLVPADALAARPVV